MDHSGHAGHFLGRVDRLSTQHAELALGLYRDHELVRYLLEKAELPDNSKRVALCLDDDKRGPFIIVTRAGRFVTCLAAGMRIPNSQPMIARNTLDRLSRTVQALRDLVAKAESGRRHETNWLLRRVMRAGSDLVQDEFDDLVAWTPLMRYLYFEVLIRSIEHSSLAYQRLRSIKHIGRRHERLLRAYWEASWAVAHLTALVGADRSTLQTALDECDKKYGASAERRVYFVQRQVEMGVLPFVTRGAWLAAKLPKVFLSSLKQLYYNPDSPDAMLACGLGLAATGFRHRRYEAEVRKAINRIGRPAWDRPDLATALRNLFNGCYERGLRDQENAVADYAQALLQAAVEEKICAPEQMHLVEEMPAQAKLATVAQLPFPVWQREQGPLQLVLWLPEVARAKPRDLYVPRAYSGLLQQGWHLNTGKAFLEPRRNMEYRIKPKVSERRPRRNEPCPCGSGKKYKRCCGMS